MGADANLKQAEAQLRQAQVNLERTRIVSPVDGYVTNLLAQTGDFVNAGANTISVVDANSFWVDGYFEETNLGPIRVGDQAHIKLMGHGEIVRGHVDSIARAINVANAQPAAQGVANVNPIFTWVRLAQRIPVRVDVDEVPAGLTLSAGMTATVQIDDRDRSSPDGESHRSVDQLIGAAVQRAFAPRAAQDRYSVGFIEQRREARERARHPARSSRGKAAAPRRPPSPPALLPARRRHPGSPRPGRRALTRLRGSRFRACAASGVHWRPARNSGRIRETGAPEWVSCK
jgi:hypothetical protein